MLNILKTLPNSIKPSVITGNIIIQLRKNENLTRHVKMEHLKQIKNLNLLSNVTISYNLFT